MKSCVIFGAGVFGKLAYECLKDRYQILAYVDNNVKKQGSYLNGLRILLPPQGAGPLCGLRCCGCRAGSVSDC